MSLLLPQYEAHLLSEIEEEDLSPEELSPATLCYFDRLFKQACASEATPPFATDPTDVPPGPLRVTIYRERFSRGEAVFRPGDLKLTDLKKPVVRRVTARNPLNGNPLSSELAEEEDAIETVRDEEASRKQRRREKREPTILQLKREST